MDKFVIQKCENSSQDQMSRSDATKIWLL